MTKLTIGIEIDTGQLSSHSDSHLALLWDVAQANPVPLGDKHAGEIARKIGSEIIRRWLKGAPHELYRHQDHHYYWAELRKLGKWIDGEFVAHTVAEGDGGERP